MLELNTKYPFDEPKRYSSKPIFVKFSNPLTTFLKLERETGIISVFGIYVMLPGLSNKIFSFAKHHFRPSEPFTSIKVDLEEKLLRSSVKESTELKTSLLSSYLETPKEEK